MTDRGTRSARLGRAGVCVAVRRGARPRPLPPPSPFSGNCRLQLPLLPQPRPKKEPEAGTRAEVGPAAMAVTAPESALPPLPLPPRRAWGGPGEMKRGRCAAGLLSRRGDAVCRGRLSPTRRRRGGCLPPRPPRGGGLCSAGGVSRALCPALRPGGGRGAERSRCLLIRGGGWCSSRRPSPWPPAPPGATHRRFAFPGLRLASREGGRWRVRV